MKSKSGFTMIEVSLFLALSAALFLVVAVGVQNSIYQQRSNDAVQSFTDFLKNVYSEVTNVQNNDGGRSDKAIYGKLVTFGESTNLSGEPNEDGTIFSYTVVGNIENDMETGSTLTLLNKLGANVVVKNDSDGKAQYAGMVKDYDMKWSSVLQNKDADDNNSVFKAALLVVRHPKSGSVSTYIMKDWTVNVNEYMGTYDGGLLTQYMVDNGEHKFELEAADFCVNPYGDDGAISNRVDVKIAKGAKTSTAVNAFYDSEENVCRGEK